MSTGSEHHMGMVGQANLIPIIRRALADETATMVDWFYQPLEGGFSGSALYRFQGKAQTANGVHSWSLILKVINPTTGGPTPEDGDYWMREVLVYQSGLLDDLPGDLVAPRRFTVVEYAVDEFWLWLEDITEAGDGVWPLERYGLAARHLGRFNGAYLTTRPLPHYPWLRTGDLRQRLALAEPGIAELPQLRHNPLFAELLPDDHVERMIGLWEKRAPLLALLDQLPRTFCHGDAFRRNLMTRRGAHGREETVAIDWGAAGVGMLGEELIPLYAATLRFVEVDSTRIAELDGLIFAGYLAGLRDAGWQGEERLARFGFAALAALKKGVAAPAISLPKVARRAAALPPGAEPPRLLGPGPAQYVALHQHLLVMGEEAWTLLDELE